MRDTFMCFSLGTIGNSGSERPFSSNCRSMVMGRMKLPRESCVGSVKLACRKQSLSASFDAKMLKRSEESSEPLLQQEMTAPDLFCETWYQR